MRWFALVLATLALVPGCHEDVELDPGGRMDADASGQADAFVGLDAGDSSETSDALTCAPIGASCALTSDCCSTRCVGSVCVSAGCEKVGATCSVGNDCCGGVCTASVCVAVAGCAPTGEICTSGAECCSRTCAIDPQGTMVCQPLGGCATAGELCRSDADCCGGAVGACGAIDAITGLGRCLATTGCAAPGELCRVAGDATATRECCPGGTPAHGLCRPTRIGDADRCESDRASMMCLAVGVSCATPDECCTAVCAPDASGAFVCASACRPNGDACTRSADCCAGECASGLCTGVRTCGPLGATCVLATDCCSQTCIATICAAPPM